MLKQMDERPFYPFNIFFIRDQILFDYFAGSNHWIFLTGKHELHRIISFRYEVTFSTLSAMTDTWMMIVNPNAGIRKGTRDWPKIMRLLHEEGVPFEFRLTGWRSHATRLAAESIGEGYRKICVIGGDGTLNEVLNGIMGQQLVPPETVVLGMIPVGTGNDWCRMFRIPFDYRKAIHLLKREKTLLQDVGKLTYANESGNHERYFMNVAGMGYDALVAWKTNLMKERGKGGAFLYLWFVFASLFGYKFMDAVIEVDRKIVFRGEIFSMNVGICKYSGGGMMQVPDAIHDDGLFDLMVIRKVSKWVVFRHAHRLYDGSLVRLPIVFTSRGSSVRIRSTGRIYIETDGESLGHSPFVFEMLPKTLRIVTGTD